MKTRTLVTIWIALGLCLALGACSKESSGADTKAAEADTYGKGLQAAETVAISEILKDPKAYEGKTVRVEGTVTDVCPKRGCWFEMAGDQDNQKMRFKVRDGDMVFPMDAKGRYAVAEGVVFTQTLSMEDTRKYLEYQASEYGADVDPESATEPVTIVRLNGVGAEIRDAR